MGFEKRRSNGENGDENDEMATEDLIYRNTVISRKEISRSHQETCEDTRDEAEMA